MSRKRHPGYCVICGVWRDGLHKDHIVPKWKGGSEDPSNIQRICANCHEDKSNAENQSADGREHHRQKMLGRVITVEHRQRISQSRKGQRLSDQTKKKISFALAGNRNRRKYSLKSI